MQRAPCWGGGGGLHPTRSPLQAGSCTPQPRHPGESRALDGPRRGRRRWGQPHGDCPRLVRCVASQLALGPVAKAGHTAQGAAAEGERFRRAVGARAMPPAVPQALLLLHRPLYSLLPAQLQHLSDTQSVFSLLCTCYTVVSLRSIILMKLANVAGKNS